jgi:Bacterial Ig-like domain (group 3)
LKRLRGVGPAAATAVVAGVLALPAAGAGIGPGTGTSSFTLEKLASGADSDPRVAMAGDRAALAVFVNFASAHGVFHVCRVPLDQARCTRTTVVKPTDDAGAMSLVRSGSRLLLGNGTANYTELFASTNNGAAFGSAVRISNYVDAENILPLPGGSLLLVGRGNDADANAMHVAVVSPDGKDVNTHGFVLEGATFGSGNRGVALNGGRYVVLTGGFVSAAGHRTRIEYAVYSGSGDPNSLSNWSKGSVAGDFLDPPNIAGGPAGVVLVTLNGGKVMASKLAGKTFGALKPIGDAAGKAYLPNVTQDATGRVTATWQVNGVGLRESHSFDGVRWSAPRTLTDDREFDTDTATGPAGNGLAVTRAGGGYLATRIYAAVGLTLKASPKRVAKGKSITLTAKLTSDRGKPFAGGAIRFRAGSKTVATQSTDKSGGAKVELEPAGTTRYQAAFAGNGQTASYTTAPVTVSVKP